MACAMQNDRRGGSAVSAFVLRAGGIRRLAGLAGAIAVGALLAACVRDPLVTATNTAAAGNWRIERETDRITGAPISSARLDTRTVSNAAIVFAPPAELQLTCFKDQPVAVFAFAFKIGSTRNAELSYRFDDKPGHMAQVRFTEDFQRAVIEDRSEVARFAGEMATSNVLYVLIRSINRGRTSAEFRPDDAPAAIAAAFAGCPLR
jgi:hypothetical protein